MSGSEDATGDAELDAADIYPTETTEALAQAVQNYQQLLQATAEDLQFQKDSSILTDSDVRDAVKKIGYREKVSKYRVFGAGALTWTGGTIVEIALCAVLNIDSHGAATDEAAAIIRQQIHWPRLGGYVFIGVILTIAGWYVREHD